MKKIYSTVGFTALLAILFLPVGSQPSSAAESGQRTIAALAAATTSTVFAETSYQSSGGYNFDNGSFWYRDGYPYANQNTWAQGGWGVSSDPNYGTNHPNNCQGNIDPEGVCFATGDVNGQYAPHGGGYVCGWYSCWYNSPYYYYDYGQRGYMQSGGTLAGASNPQAYRVFFTADNPSYYPSGIQENVNLKDIYAGGWRLCFSGNFSDSRTRVSDIEALCNGNFTIMGGSYSDPHIQAPTASSPLLSVTSDGSIAASWQIHNIDGLSIDSGTAQLTDNESGFAYQCELGSFDSTQIDSSIGCLFNAPERHHYSLAMTFNSGIFGSLNADSISDQLVISNDFQVVPYLYVTKVASQLPVCIYHGPSNRIAMIKVGAQTLNVQTDGSGYGCASFLMPEKPGRFTVKGIFKKQMTTPVYVYTPTFKFGYKSGKNPVFSLESKTLPATAHVVLSLTSRATGQSQNLTGFVTQDMKSMKLIGNLSAFQDTYDLIATVNGVFHVSAVIDVVPTFAAGGLRK